MQIHQVQGFCMNTSCMGQPECTKNEHANARSRKAVLVLATCLAVVQICISKAQLEQLKRSNFSVAVVISFAEKLV